MSLVLKVLVRVVVFGIVIAFVTRRDSKVIVEPRSALPTVAAVFAVLNVLLYSFLWTVLNISTLFLLFFVVPFVANAILLWVTDKLVKSFRVDGLPSLAFASLCVTLAHLALRLLHV
jgi:uncharacterized membrane protein YvlD (DUF360 family)